MVASHLGNRDVLEEGLQKWAEIGGSQGVISGLLDALQLTEQTKGNTMLMRWRFLFELLWEICACYCAMAFGRRVETSNRLHRVYLWRGKRYAI